MSSQKRLLWPGIKRRCRRRQPLETVKVKLRAHQSFTHADTRRHTSLHCTSVPPYSSQQGDSSAGPLIPNSCGTWHLRNWTSLRRRHIIIIIIVVAVPYSTAHSVQAFFVLASATGIPFCTRRCAAVAQGEAPRSSFPCQSLP